MTWRSTTSSGGCGRSAIRSASWRRARPPRSGSTSTHRTSCATSRCESRGARHVARRARGIIVHSAFCARYLAEAGCRTPVFVVPHPIVETETDMRRAVDRAAELRAERAAKGMRSLVVAPGDLNQAKQLDAVLAAARELDDDVHVVLVGRRIEGYDVDAHRRRRSARRSRRARPRRLRRRLPRMARRGRRRRRPAVPASGRGERVA